MNELLRKNDRTQNRRSSSIVLASIPESCPKTAQQTRWCQRSQSNERYSLSPKPVKSQWTHLNYSLLSFLPHSVCSDSQACYRCRTKPPTWLTAVLRSAVVFGSVVWVFSGGHWQWLVHPIASPDELSHPHTPRPAVMDWPVKIRSAWGPETEQKAIFAHDKISYAN